MATSHNGGLSYAEFGTWYDDYRASVLEPALEAGLSALASMMDDGLSSRDRSRIRNLTGRVKSKRRTWRKMQQSQYQGVIRTTADIPSQIHDLVGLRITCTNLRDVDTVQAAIEALPAKRTRNRGLTIDMASSRDYIRQPKESGYRAWHVMGSIDVIQANNKIPVTYELQVRTVLQDSWGELTHEDTYSKDGELPPLVEVLSKRIADLFATLDDIAEDLRTELDRIDEAAIAEGDDSMIVPDPLTGSGQAADAASMLLDRWQRLDRPVDLASLAWELQQEFGAEISDDWFGHRSFKRFLTAAVPNGEISTGRQTYLIPFDYGARVEPPVDVSADDLDDGDEPAPGEPLWTNAATRLRGIDRGFPMVEGEIWPQIYDGLAEAWRRMGPTEISPNVLNRLTRSARDRADAAGVTLSRRHLDYVAKTVITPDDDEPLNSDEIARRFAALTVQRMIDLRIMDDDNVETRASIIKWLGAVDGPPGRT